MATVAVPARIDPTHRANFGIIIGEDLLREENPRKRQRLSVQYNHRPEGLKDTSTSIVRSEGEDENALRLSNKSNEERGKYIFEGTQKTSASLALTYDHEKKSFVLDRIHADCFFNLRTTPSEHDAAKNMAKYPQIGRNESSADEANTIQQDNLDEFETQPPDSDNPFDYRHFLNRSNSPPHRLQTEKSPRPLHALHSSPLMRTTSPLQRPRSRTTTGKPPRSRRRHVSPEPPRKTKIHKDLHDPNELVIDMGDSEPNPSKNWHRSFLGDMLNERGRTGDRKPMSMRSAASSMSPSVRAESDNERDDKRDNDVEEIDLGESRFSRIEAGKDDEGAVSEGNGWDDEVDDILQQEMDEAMESQGGQKQEEPAYTAAITVESSEESEEE